MGWCREPVPFATLVLSFWPKLGELCGARGGAPGRLIGVNALGRVDDAWLNSTLQAQCQYLGCHHNGVRRQGECAAGRLRIITCNLHRVGIRSEALGHFGGYSGSGTLSLLLHDAWARRRVNGVVGVVRQTARRVPLLSQRHVGRCSSCPAKCGHGRDCCWNKPASQLPSSLLRLFTTR